MPSPLWDDEWVYLDPDEEEWDPDKEDDWGPDDWIEELQEPVIGYPQVRIQLWKEEVHTRSEKPQGGVHQVLRLEREEHLET